MYKKDFPFFKNTNTVYLDNAATTQKPNVVIDKIVEYYTHFCANTHRSNFGDANKATKEFENTRNILKDFINAKDAKQIIFTKGITESLNLIASTYAKKFKTVIISSLEHHSNITPWHMQGRTLNDGLEVVNIKDNLEFDFEHFEELLKVNPNSLVSVTHVSNAFGTKHDIKKIAKLTHKYNSYIMIDAAQSLAHFKVDVQDLDVDFYAMSGHKTYGPTGVGALYIKEELLKELPVYQTGGATINDVNYERSIMLDSPYKFEAGTQNIAGVIGFSQALNYLNNIGIEKVFEIEDELYKYLNSKLEKIPGIILYNNVSNSIASKSFNIENINCEDIGILLDKMHIAVRAGHHCAQPIMKKLNIDGTIRASIAFYNTKDDIDKFIKGLKKAITMLKD
ncbi:selenocysteine lyase [Malaciobacter molluscorum LMG 25693]|uniref:Probable cysteine desulfurase n=1 Tax=Malaciobacter molluscorum LMG 25693 TaxID=870501 RepID=A0A2G1DFY5_9BACT|nr:cysteine desulfurase [Malaciobacter molluscorum]AXX91713.1 cysteine desulfurase [Malaciobacter molluscorum LMG 25693]PHO17399.1 selenocysteine lyase [Malaciobacter molluscorum LMG 25693]